MFKQVTGYESECCNMPVSVIDTFHTNLPITFPITVAAISTEHFYEIHTFPHAPQQLHHL